MGQREEMEGEEAPKEGNGGDKEMTVAKGTRWPSHQAVCAPWLFFLLQ